MQRVLPPRGSLRPCSALVCPSQAIGFWLVLWYHFDVPSCPGSFAFCSAAGAAPSCLVLCLPAKRQLRTVRSQPGRCFWCFCWTPACPGRRGACLPPGSPPRCCRWPQVPGQSPGLCPGLSCACPPAGVSLQPERAVPKHLPVGQRGQKPGTMGTIREWLVVLGPRWWSLDCPVIAQHCLHPTPRSISPLLIHTARLGPLSSLLPSFVCLAAAR